ncbi:hypothetical protein GCM10023081_36560 [Arthrobacter ginkgonis]|uniref:PucR C-terminal helix-turn-helix domain-containing protein n=1 Tax=Arthrobacter ginkgonis TaxID=1630594 RepID=A0ABP7CYD7_9MICC
MNTELQRLADRLAEKLGRAVEIDDRQMLPLAVTRQSGTVDSVRVTSVLNRESSPEVRRFIYSLGIDKSVGPVRYPANKELGTWPRIGFPLRHEGVLHGYLWLIDEPSLSEPELHLCEATADMATEVLLAEAQAQATNLDREHAIVQYLLGDDAFRDMPDSEGIVSLAESMTAVYGAIGKNGQGLTRSEQRSLASNLSYIRPSGRSVLGATEHGLLLVAPSEFVAKRLEPFKDDVGRWAEKGGHVVKGWGIGSEALGLESLRASVAHARHASRVAGASGREEAHWSTLGADVAFFGLEWSIETIRLLYPGVEVLLLPENRTLRETLMAYLDSGGDTAVAAEALNVHRTTFYYRLDKLRSVLGTGWERGEHRLGAHLALLLARRLEADS